MTVVCLITGDDETAYMEEVSDLVLWCQDNNLTLNFSKNKELIVDNRKWGWSAHPHPHQPGCSGTDREPQIHQCPNHYGFKMVHAYSNSREEGATVPLRYQVEKIWHGLSNPLNVLQLHH